LSSFALFSSTLFSDFFLIPPDISASARRTSLYFCSRYAKVLVVYGAWCMVHGAWCMVHGAWFMVHGAWCMVHGAWCMVRG